MTDELTTLWYDDGVQLLRCKVCQHLKTAGHRPLCPVRDLVAAVTGLLEAIRAQYPTFDPHLVAAAERVIATVDGEPT